ncbi:GNAT family N-acetyltransferase [Paenibacillus jiagnxiensis]|uniref:GNAT family N-acetyltransferase n=1 Tax=Paenibacillus jiagnxiensis TaxID=3228926 RepID=UPI0033AC4D9B
MMCALSTLSIRICSDEDLDLLAVLNKQLIEDEQNDNSMTAKQLKERLRTFIHGGYKAYLFEERGETIGYALVDHGRQPLYLRQFFISRDCRRKGYGKLSFERLQHFLGTNNLDVEVMYWNSSGYEFWKSLGFRERSIYMRL